MFELGLDLSFSGLERNQFDAPTQAVFKETIANETGFFTVCPFTHRRRTARRAPMPPCDCDPVDVGITSIAESGAGTTEVEFTIAFDNQNTAKQSGTRLGTYINTGILLDDLVVAKQNVFANVTAVSAATPVVTALAASSTCSKDTSSDRSIWEWIILALIVSVPCCCCLLCLAVGRMRNNKENSHKQVQTDELRIKPKFPYSPFSHILPSETEQETALHQEGFNRCFNPDSIEFEKNEMTSQGTGRGVGIELVELEMEKKQMTSQGTGTGVGTGLVVAYVPEQDQNEDENMNTLGGYIGPGMADGPLNHVSIQIPSCCASREGTTIIDANTPKPHPIL